MFKKFGRWLTALIGLLPMAAFADTTGPFTVKDSDISLKILSQLFGGLTSSGGTDAFGSAISTFNGAILIVGGILATYTLLAGTLGTAHDGEMLGKKFSSVWIPIRYALGTALVLPVLTGGYCIMQQLVMWCILQGVGLANAVWTSYLSSPNLTIPVHMTTAHKKSVLNFANNVALAQICVQANASVLNEGGTAGGLIDGINKALMTYDYKVAYSTDGKTAYFGDQAGKLTLITRSICGSANLPAKPSASSVITPTSTGTGGKLGDISSAFRMGDISPVYDAHVSQSKDLIQNIGVLAKAAVTAETPLSEASVQAEADKYIIAIEASANSYANGNASPFAGIIAASQDQGWLLAGAWFTKLAMMNQTLNDAVNSIPTASSTWQLGSSFKFLDAIQPKIGAARTEIMDAMNITVPDSTSDEKDDSKGKNTQSSSMWSKTVQWFVEVFTGLDLEQLQDSTKHPLLVLQDAGNRMISAWSIAATGLMAVMAIAGVKVLGNGWDGGPVVFTLIGFAFLPIAGLVALGFTLAYLLPNLPFLMWIGIVLGWLIMCVEAILAAPLWAVMHLHPNGDDLTGRGGNGYMLLLGLLLRPALTIFGLIAALVLTELMGEFVNKIFFSVFFSGSSAGWGTGLVTILSVVFSMTVYTSAMVQLFRKTFSLMHVIPDQLMRWIGGGQEQMGQYAGGLAEAGQKGVQSAAAASSFLGERTAQTGGQAINQAKGIKDQRAQTRAREAATQSEITSQKENFSNAIGSDSVSKMDARTENAENALSQSNPMSQQGLTLRDSQNKMLKARSQGESQITSSMGATGKANYLNALADGNYKGQSVSEMSGSNDFEREANFASAVSTTMMQENQAANLEASSTQQSTANEQGQAQISALNNINSKLDNMGKPNDPTISPANVGSTNGFAGGSSSGNSGAQIQQGAFNQTAQNNVQANVVNSAFDTNLQGELLNPSLAQTMATSNVNPLGRNLTGNTAHIINHGGSSSGANHSAPTQPVNIPDPMSASQAVIQSPESASSTSLSNNDSNNFTPIGSNVDSSSNAQFSTFNSQPTDGSSASQSFDGSGTGQTGTPFNDPNKID